MSRARKRRHKCPKCGRFRASERYRCEECYNEDMRKWYTKQARKGKADYEQVFALFDKYD